MKINDHTILITGGATGIGFALAEALVREDNEVIICGRREHKLREAKNKLPQIHTKVCDISKGKEREALYNWVKSNFTDINILVNNAGIQRMIDFKKGIPPSEVARATLMALKKDEYEIAIGMAQNLRMGAKNNPEKIFQSINQ
jgi:short-subunit dehydrogenase involved in D-alanine esterification of teichoic acids